MYSTNKNVLQVFSISLLAVVQGKCDSIILNLLFFLPGNLCVAVQYCPSGVNFLVAVLQGSIQLQSACSNGMCIKRVLAEDRILPASLMLWPSNFLIDVSWALKMQEQILIPSYDKLRSAMAGHLSFQRAVCAQPENHYLLAPSNLFSGESLASVTAFCPLLRAKYSYNRSSSLLS